MHPLTARGIDCSAAWPSATPGGRAKPLHAEAELAEVVAARRRRAGRQRPPVQRAIRRGPGTAAEPAAGDVPDDLWAADRALASGPRGQGLQVGGDFNDVLPRRRQLVVVAVGDVCGQVEAAALTGLVRANDLGLGDGRSCCRPSSGASTRRCCNTSGWRFPVLDATARPSTPWAFRTVVIGAVKPTPEGVDIVLCLGGHPHPLVRRADGRVVPGGGGHPARRDRLREASPTGSSTSTRARSSCVSPTASPTGGWARCPSVEEGVADAVRSAEVERGRDGRLHRRLLSRGYSLEEPTDDMAVPPWWPTPAAAAGARQSADGALRAPPGRAPSPQRGMRRRVPCVALRIFVTLRECSSVVSAGDSTAAPELRFRDRIWR